MTSQSQLPLRRRRAYQKKAAGYLADLILDSLEQFPKKERHDRLKKVHKALSRRLIDHPTRVTRASSSHS